MLEPALKAFGSSIVSAYNNLSHFQAQAIPTSSQLVKVGLTFRVNYVQTILN
jgi:hypothetical protein